MEPRMTIVTLGVSDLPRSVAFYREGLKLPLREGTGEEIAFFETAHVWLALYPRDSLASDAGFPARQAGGSSGDAFPGFTIAHNVRTRERVDEVLNEAVAAGGRVVKPAEEASWGGYSGYFADPDGFLWEVAWNPHFWVE